MSKIPHFVSSVPSINTHGLASDSLPLIPRLVTLEVGAYLADGNACPQAQEEQLNPVERDLCNICAAQLEEGRTGLCDDCDSYSPTPDQLATLELFKREYSPAVCRKRGFQNWKEALFVAWYQGWDDRCEGGHHLRQMRNTRGAHEWLHQQPLN